MIPKKDRLIYYGKNNGVQDTYLGPNLNSDSGFDTPSGWQSIPEYWTIANGVATCNGLQPSSTFFYRSCGIEQGKTYKIRYEIKECTSGLFQLNIGGYTPSTAQSTVGTHTELLTTNAVSGNDRLYISALTGFAGVVDNVYIWEIITVEDKDWSGNQKVLSYSGTPTYVTNNAGKQVKKFDDGQARVTHLNNAGDGLTPNDRIGDGETYTYAGRRCVKFDGTGDYIVFSHAVGAHLYTNDCEVIVSCKTPDAFTKVESIFAANIEGSARFGLRFSATGSLYFVGADAGGAYASSATGIALSVSTEYEFKVGRSGNNGYVYIKGGAYSDWTLLGNSYTAYTVPSTTEVVWISWPNTNTFSGEIYSFEIVDIVKCLFEEGANDIVYDSSGNGNHGTLVPTEGAGDATGIARMRDARADVVSNNILNGFTQGVVFDGSTDVATLDSVVTIQDGDEFECWLYIPENASTSTLDIIGGTTNSNEVGVQIGGSNRKFYYRGNGGSTYYSTINKFVVNTLFKFKVEFNLSTGIRMYVDDVDIGTNFGTDALSFAGFSTPDKLNCSMISPTFSRGGTVIHKWYPVKGSGLIDQVGTNDASITPSDAFYGLHVPVLASGTSDANGNSITNNGHYVHNGADIYLTDNVDYVSNGDFTTDLTGWGSSDASVVGGECVIQSGGYITQTMVDINIGDMAEISFDVVSGEITLDWSPSDLGPYGEGSHTIYVEVVGLQLGVRFDNNYPGDTTIDNVVVKKLMTYDELINHDDTGLMYTRTTGNYVSDLIFEETDSSTSNASIDLPLNLNNFTVSFRINSSDNYTSFDRPIFEHFEGSNYNIWIGLTGIDDKVVSFNIANGSYELDGLTNVTDGVDHIITCTYDGSTTKIYVDGKLDNSMSAVGPLESSETTIWIGKDSTYNFDGIISDIMVWNIVLTATEIKSLVRGLINPPKYEVKKKGILNFDGVGDYVVIPNAVASVIYESDCDVYCHFRTPSAILKNEFIWGGNIGSYARFALRYISSGSLYFYGANAVGGLVSQPLGVVLASDTEYQIRVQRSGNTGIVHLKGGAYSDWTLIIDSLTAYPLDGASAIIWLSYPNTYTFSGKMYSFEVVGVGKYTFEEASGTTVYDGSGNNNHGTLVSSSRDPSQMRLKVPLTLDDPSLVFATRDGIIDTSGKNTITNNNTIVGNRMQFNGVDSYLSFNGSNVFWQVANGITIKAIVTINDIGSNQNIIKCGGPTSNNFIYQNFMVRTANGGYVQFNVGDASTSSFITSDNILVESKKIEIVCTIDTDRAMKMYINGVLQSDTNTAVSTPYTTQKNIYIGVATSFITDQLNGLLNNIEIYNEAKSAEWVKNDYEKEVRYW